MKTSLCIACDHNPARFGHRLCEPCSDRMLKNTAHHVEEPVICDGEDPPDRVLFAPPPPKVEAATKGPVTYPREPGYWPIRVALVIAIFFTAALLWAHYLRHVSTTLEAAGGWH